MMVTCHMCSLFLLKRPEPNKRCYKTSGAISHSASAVFYFDTVVTTQVLTPAVLPRFIFDPNPREVHSSASGFISSTRSDSTGSYQMTSSRHVTVD